MNQLPIQKAPPEERQRLMEQMYLLLGKQVKSYHKHHHMGENTSVPVELAQELMYSVEYTLDLAGGVAAGRDIEQTLRAGQAVLEARVRKARSLLELVTATAPRWQTECRWEAIGCLGRYLDTYDPLHLAHRGPEDLFYPTPIPEPDGLRGIDRGLFFLNVLWLENQVMAGFDDEILEKLWNRLPADTLNQFEQLLLNGIGKALLYDRPGGLTFAQWERERLSALLSGGTGARWDEGARLLCGWLDLLEGNARESVRAAAAELLPRVRAALSHGDLSAVFL